MKLNIHQIFERTPYRFDISFEREKETAQIIEVKYFRKADKEHNTETIYIVEQKEADIFASAEPLHLLFLSQPPSDFLPENTLSCTYLCTQDISAEKIFDSIQDSITWFHMWEQRIYHAILNDSPLKDILNICAQALCNPIAVFDLYQNLLFSAGSLPQLSSRSGLWDYVLDHGRSPEESEIESDMSKKLKSFRKPFYYQSENPFRNINRLIGPLYHKDSLFGMLALSDVA